jgi:uncharacterized Fe-S radical SAM superfamily protein PflX
MLNGHLTKSIENFKTDKFYSMSNLFKGMKLESDIHYDKVNENEDIITFHKRSELNRDKLDEMAMIKQYDEIYKPKIKYNFTEYNYIYSSHVNINKHDGLIEHASVVLAKKIKNNLICSANCEINRIEL